MSEWIAVKERLPEKYERFLVAIQYPDLPSGSLIVLDAIFHGDGWCDPTCGDLKGTVTHWMPLPEPPIQSKPLKKKKISKRKHSNDCDHTKRVKIGMDWWCPTCQTYR